MDAWFNTTSITSETDAPLSYTRGDVSDDGQGNYEMSLTTGEAIQITYLVVYVFSIPGNLVTLLVILTSIHMRSKPFNMLLCHQAITDTLPSIIFIVLHLAGMYMHNTMFYN